MTSRWKRRVTDGLHIYICTLGCITYHVARCSYDFIMPRIYGNTFACFIFLKFSSPPCHWQPKFWNHNGGSKNKVLAIFSFWLSQRCALMRAFQIWSQNWNWITSDPIFGPKTIENWQNTLSYQFLTVFIGQNGVKCYPIPILRPDLKSSHQGASFRPQNERIK